MSRLKFLIVLFIMLFGVRIASSQQIHVFAKGTSHSLWTKVWDGTQWLEWADLGGNITLSPDACYRGGGMLTVFVSSTGNSTLMYMTRSGTSWHPWESMGFKTYSSPSCVANHEGDQLDVFMQGNDAGLWYAYFKNGEWQNKQTIPAAKDWGTPTFQIGAAPWGGKMRGGPDACSWGGKRIDVFVRGADNHLWHIYVDNNGNKQAWEDLGGNLTSDPSCVSRGNGLIDVVARGGDNALWITSYENGKWSGWTSWGGQLSSAPDACSWGGKRLDVFARGGNGELWHIWRNDEGGMSQWESRGGQLATNSDPSCTAFK